MEESPGWLSQHQSAFFWQPAWSLPNGMVKLKDHVAENILWSDERKSELFEENFKPFVEHQALLIAC